VPEERVVAVIVTFNRRDLLEASLAAVRRQSRAADHVVVVDNASTDGTTEVLDAAGVDVVRLRHNTGGAGGFAAGVDRALALGADAIWLLDDDTEPDVDALAAMCDVRREYTPPTSRDHDGPVHEPVLVASRVVWGGPPGGVATGSDRGLVGRDHPMNTPRVKPGVRAVERAAAEAVGCFPIRSASFVSILVDAAVVRERGLPVADYFLWNDDFEYTTRLARGHYAVACPRSIAVHRTVSFGTTDADPGDRFYYEVRNKVWLFSRSRGLSPVEKVTYGGSTLRRWTRTFVRSDDRGRLWQGLRAGLADALRRGPRDTRRVLAEAADPGDPDG
jgi:rhamnopyranosyl-N-acetylglucosaminyl-diphospho-decaprenol beta-1,3/1,4-galactofuranosyltransferase